MSRTHSPSFPSLHLCHSSFSSPSLALPTSQLIHQPFRCFTYVTAHSSTLVLLLLCHGIFTYVTWRAAHATRGRTITSFPYFTCISCYTCNLHSQIYSHLFVVIAKLESIDMKLRFYYVVLMFTTYSTRVVTKCTESFIYYARQQTAVARGLAWLARRFMRR